MATFFIIFPLRSIHGKIYTYIHNCETFSISLCSINKQLKFSYNFHPSFEGKTVIKFWFGNQKSTMNVHFINFLGSSKHRPPKWSDFKLINIKNCFHFIKCFLTTNKHELTHIKQSKKYCSFVWIEKQGTKSKGVSISFRTNK